MHNYTMLFYFATTALLVGCGSETVQEKNYLNIDSLITTQVGNLVNANARIAKNASLNEASSKSEFTTDSIGWATELDIFRQLDVINKPTNKDSYLIIDGEKDVHSNLTIRLYQAKGELPVQALKLYYYQNLQNLKKLEAVYKEKNTLYSTERSLTMGFDEVAGKTVLTNYSVDGIQKMIFSDTVHFNIQCNVIFQ